MNIEPLIPHSDPLPELPEITDSTTDTLTQISVPLPSPSENTPCAPDLLSPPSSPHTVSSSSDKSSIEIHTVVIPRKRPANMSDNKEAVASHLALSCPPHLSKGKITPNNVWEFENHCENYYMNAKGGVEDGQKVMKILGCFENPLVNDWISVNRTRLCVLTFEDFMIEFRQHWLPRNWEEDVAMCILSSRLDPKQMTFEEWAAQLQMWNIALHGTDSHIDDEQMRQQLDANLDTELCKKTRNEKVTTIKELLPWIQKVLEIDDLRQTEQKHFAEAIDDCLRANKHPYNPACSVNPNRDNYRWNTSNASGTTAAGPSTTIYPPKLTEDERRLLHEHEGCLKCCAFYAGHQANKCTTTISGRNYKQLTQQDAL